MSKTVRKRNNDRMKHKVVGVSVQKLEGRQKATGEAIFGGDIYLSGMLHGKILRSKYPHARILNIDTSRAEKLPGVKAVITWRDAPDIKIGFYTDDWRLFAKNKVRYRGDVVAAVAAIDSDIAAEGRTGLDFLQERLLDLLPHHRMRRFPRSRPFRRSGR